MEEKVLFLVVIALLVFAVFSVYNNRHVGVSNNRVDLSRIDLTGYAVQPALNCECAFGQVKVDQWTTLCPNGEAGQKHCYYYCKSNTQCKVIIKNQGDASSYVSTFYEGMWSKNTCVDNCDLLT